MLLCGRVLAWLIPTLTGCQLATQLLAAHWGFHAALGTPWLTLGWLRLYAPWSWMVWLWRYQAQAPDVFPWPLRIAASGALVGLLCSVGLTLWAQQRRGGRETTHGSARWSDTADVKRSGFLR